MKNEEVKIAKVWGIVLAVAVCAIILTGGCEKAQKGETAGGATKIISEEMGLKAKVEQLQKENDRLRQENENLAKLPGDKRAEAIYKLQRVDIGRFSGIYKEDANGANEYLVVYVEPIDETGDAIKAAGKVEIQLWDLNKSESQAMMGHWTAEPNDLKTMWFNAIASTGYRFKYNLPTGIKKGQELTVRVTFTDYISGQVFTQQKAIK
jgi:outer membrane murein-binding lipoprotein Lpp